MFSRLSFLLAAALLVLASACSDDEPGNEAPDASAPDASAPDASAPDASAPDAAPGGDAGPGCADPTLALASPWTPVDTVSTGAVAATGNAATVDATAGGSPNAADNPYVYLKFTADSITKLEITDVDSYKDASWDVAIKRYVLRVNGGDSGPGGVEVATVVAENLADVTAAPPDGEFTTDDWATDDCALNAGPLGEPATALSDWYGYDEATNRLTPQGEIYVLRRADGSVIKLDIKTFYHDDISGYYEIEWGAL
jgi:hypothetical protein